MSMSALRSCELNKEELSSCELNKEGDKLIYSMSISGPCNERVNIRSRLCNRGVNRTRVSVILASVRPGFVYSS